MHICIIYTLIHTQKQWRSGAATDDAHNIQFLPLQIVAHDAPRYARRSPAATFNWNPFQAVSSAVEPIHVYIAYTSRQTNGCYNENPGNVRTLTTVCDTRFSGTRDTSRVDIIVLLSLLIMILINVFSSDPVQKTSDDRYFRDFVQLYR